ncbi:flagellar biosynthesis protein [Nitrospirillum amazonense]|uniref:Flagellar biosynthesis protein n=1 Tax=Nitrospirillum amazonense TaxID=28077 RepID=A0A560FJX5_9PROT|nr:EscU/YscU/HrcU family type III secretion system export apparatus switch protein [Nitrospirillum amazonense]TWB21910.1 flagellar biosynthesis protein [Nitrospirillum amazonense]
MGDSDKPRRQVAVALQHMAEGLPRIVATGQGAVAEQILELAFANGVKVRQDADLAEILSVIDIDSEIPIEALAAVAEILAHVYRANGRLSSGVPLDAAASPHGPSPYGSNPHDRPPTSPGPGTTSGTPPLR